MNDNTLEVGIEIREISLVIYPQSTTYTLEFCFFLKLDIP